jgi:chaperone modulatory protein CbpM
MNESMTTAFSATVVEEDTHLTLVELSRACDVQQTLIHGWVEHGVLEPLGDSPAEWRFVGESLKRSRLATRLTRDLELNAAGVALALDLLEEIDALRAQLKRVGRVGFR